MEKRIPESVKRRIILLIRNGHDLQSAAASAGVSPETLREWMRLGNAIPVSSFGAFARHVMIAQGQTQAMVLAKVRMSSKWQAHRWLLTKLDPEFFGDGAQGLSTGDPIEVVDSRDDTISPSLTLEEALSLLVAQIEKSDKEEELPKEKQRLAC